MQKASYDTNSMKSDADILLNQIAAVLCPSASDNAVPEAPLADIGHILLQLTEAVAEAKTETGTDERLRIALDRQEGSIRSSEYAPVPNASSLAFTGVIHYETNSSSHSPAPSVETSIIDSSLNLSECLSFLSVLPQPEYVYMSYYNSGVNELIMSSVERIYKPCDFGNVLFVIFNSSVAVVPAGLIPFTLDGLQSLIASSVNTPVVLSTGSPIAEDSSDEPPRMNLLEALNVQSDEDCSRIITVRKCHKLGFKSHIHLRQYFSRFGRVDRVVLLPMRAKPKNAMDGRGNRPSSMGFVVMETTEGAERILSFNNYSGIHEIKGWPIEVRNFVKPADKPFDREVSGVSTGIGSEFAW